MGDNWGVPPTTWEIARWSSSPSQILLSFFQHPRRDPDLLAGNICMSPLGSQYIMATHTHTVYDNTVIIYIYYIRIYIYYIIFYPIDPIYFNVLYFWRRHETDEPGQTWSLMLVPSLWQRPAGLVAVRNCKIIWEIMRRDWEESFDAQIFDPWC